MIKVAVWSQKGGVGKSIIIAEKNGEEAYNIDSSPGGCDDGIVRK
jgi:MinD superfamily P-loop ATPase